jgi:hypothetical protein
LRSRGRERGQTVRSRSCSVLSGRERAIHGPRIPSPSESVYFIIDAKHLAARMGASSSGGSDGPAGSWCAPYRLEARAMRGGCRSGVGRDRGTPGVLAPSGGGGVFGDAPGRASTAGVRRDKSDTARNKAIARGGPRWAVGGTTPRPEWSDGPDRSARRRVAPGAIPGVARLDPRRGGATRDKAIAPGSRQRAVDRFWRALFEPEPQSRRQSSRGQCGEQADGGDQSHCPARVQPGATPCNPVQPDGTAVRAGAEQSHLPIRQKSRADTQNFTYVGFASPK